MNTAIPVISCFIILHFLSVLISFYLTVIVMPPTRGVTIMRHNRIAGERILVGTFRLDAGVDMTPTVEAKPKRRDGIPGTTKTGGKRVTNG
jgi:hypothetical protein